MNLKKLLKTRIILPIFLIVAAQIAFVVNFEKHEFLYIIAPLNYVAVLIFYVLNKQNFDKIDKLFLLSFLFNILTDISIFFDYPYKLTNLSFIAITFAHIIYVYIYRFEGSITYPRTKLDYFLVVFCVYLFTVLSNDSALAEVKDDEYFFGLFYGFEEFLIIILSFYRPVNLLSYRLMLFYSFLIYYSDVTFFFYQYFGFNSSLCIISFLLYFNGKLIQAVAFLKR
jgi:hypothetical protein